MDYQTSERKQIIIFYFYLFNFALKHGFYDLHNFNTKILKSFWIYESTEGNGVQKQIYRNLHALHCGRKTRNISNKFKI